MKLPEQDGRLHKSRRIRSRELAGRNAPIPAAESSRNLPDAEIEKMLRSDRYFLAGKLAASVAHEIINPISAALNLAALMLHIMKDKGVPAERAAEFREFLSQVVSETTRAGRIASEMLTFARATSHVPELGDLNLIASQALSLASHLFKMEDVDSSCELCAGLPKIHCDSARVQQALLNLLVNAAEAVHGCPRRRIDIGTRLREDGGAILLEVRDTGEGISPAHLPRIFDAFFTTRAHLGNRGLGLTVTRCIIQSYHGSVEVESVLGAGTLVKVELPAASS